LAAIMQKRQGCNILSLQHTRILCLVGIYLAGKLKVSRLNLPCSFFTLFACLGDRVFYWLYWLALCTMQFYKKTGKFIMPLMALCYM
jgi:hypothetical protein